MRGSCIGMGIMNLRVRSRPTVVCAAVVAGLAATTALAQGPGSLPFSQTWRRPSVSSYQQIANFGLNPLQQQNSYQLFVQPALEQQQTVIEQMSINRKLGNVQQQIRTLETGSRERMLDATIRPTGHASTYMNYSHFYPMPRR